MKKNTFILGSMFFLSVCILFFLSFVDIRDIKPGQIWSYENPTTKEITEYLVLIDGEDHVLCYDYKNEYIIFYPSVNCFKKKKTRTMYDISNPDMIQILLYQNLHRELNLKMITCN